MMLCLGTILLFFGFWCVQMCLCLFYHMWFLGFFLVVVILICAFMRDAPFVYLPIMIICFCFILFDFIMIP